MRTAARPLGKAMYVASQSDKDWLQSVQRKLYTRSKNPCFAYASMESPVHNERCTPGSGKGTRKPPGAS